MQSKCIGETKKQAMLVIEEFLQCDADIVGNVNPAQANAELCNLIASTLSCLWIKKRSIYN